MQNPVPKLRQSSIISKRPIFLSKKVKTLYYLLKFCTQFFLSNIYKRVFSSFFILFRSSVIKKIVKNLLSAVFFLFFANNSRPKKTKRSQALFCKYWYVGNECKISAKNFNPTVVGSRQSFENIGGLWDFASLDWFY